MKQKQPQMLIMLKYLTNFNRCINNIDTFVSSFNQRLYFYEKTFPSSILPSYSCPDMCTGARW